MKWEAGSGRNYEAEDLGNRRILDILKYARKLEFCHGELVKGPKQEHSILRICVRFLAV